MKEAQQVELEKQKLQKEITVCEKVITMMQSDGWVQIIKPKLDRMIADVMGRQLSDGSWVRGTIDGDKDTEWLLGFRAGLIDFSNNVNNHTKAKENNEKRIKQIDENIAKGPKMPLTGDSRYA